MTREEAIQYIDGLRGEEDFPYTDTIAYFIKERNEAIDMAIEALTEPINCIKCKHYYETEDDTYVHGHCRMDTAHTDLISRADAIDVVAEEWLSEASAESPYVNDYDIDKYRELAEDLFKDIPSADAVDCTDFIEWLVDRVLDETIWEYNSVAYGEIICRKLEKLGVLEVTEEPSYYIRPSADAVQGEWQTDTDNRVVRCSVCGTFFNKHTEFFDFEVFAKYCPYCGAKMKGGAE